MRAPGFPSPPVPLFGGRALDALAGEVVVPYPGEGHDAVTPEERRRVEEYIGCTLEQSYSEFTVELKNALARMTALTDDRSTAARHRAGGFGRKRGARRVA